MSDSQTTSPPIPPPECGGPVSGEETVGIVRIPSDAPENTARKHESELQQQTNPLGIQKPPPKTNKHAPSPELETYRGAPDRAVTLASLPGNRAEQLLMNRERDGSRARRGEDEEAEGGRDKGREGRAASDARLVPASPSTRAGFFYWGSSPDSETSSRRVRGFAGPLLSLWSGLGESGGF